MRNFFAAANCSDRTKRFFLLLHDCEVCQMAGTLEVPAILDFSFNKKAPYQNWQEAYFKQNTVLFE